MAPSSACRRAHRFIALLAINGVLQSVTLVALSLFMWRLSPDALRIAPGRIILVCGLLIALQVALSHAERILRATYGQSIAHDVRMRLTRQLPRVSAFGPSAPKKDLLLRFVGDANALKNWYARGLVSLLVSPIILVATISAMAWVQPAFAVALIMVLLIVGCAQGVSKASLGGHADRLRKARGRLTRRLLQRFDALASYQLYVPDRARRQPVRRASNALRVEAVENVKAGSRIRALVQLANASLPIGAMLLVSTQPSQGMGAPLAFMITGGFLVPRMRELGRLAEFYAAARTAQRRISNFLNKSGLDPRSGARPLRPRSGALRLRNLRLSPHDKKPLNKRARAGDRVAIIGPNGSGKSSLLRILAGLQDAASGDYVIDRQSAGKRRRHSIQRAVGLVSHDLPLVRGSVRDNVDLRGDNSFRLALEQWGYGPFIETLRNGENTRTDVAASELSLGQRKRVEIFRALAREPRLLLLDEVDANLDQSGQTFIASLFDHFDGTILMVSHTSRWIDRCNRVWRLNTTPPQLFPGDT